MYRVGQGFDSHRFVEGRPLIIGGLEIPCDFGLQGHSDADVLVHAIIDALLGASGIGSIGEFFPDTDPEYKDANSIDLLIETRDIMGAYQFLNIDATVIAQEPKLQPHLKQIRENIAVVLDMDMADVNVKAKTAEGMGFIGDGEGIAVLANVMLKKI